MSGISVAGTNDVTAELVFGHQFGSADRDATPLPAAPAASIPADARKLNVEGEAAYKAGDYPDAIRLFQSAIDEADSYGQAYSNLGLVFQKSGRVAEALWANRKAIALATGSRAATTRASAHFNNGRIYEDAGQFGDALREYLAAQSEKANPTYDNAVARMQQRRAD
jgi:tetratricopeptide (TPR) repeat protein